MKNRFVDLPVSLSYTQSEIKEIYPHLSGEQIDAIMNAAYELKASFDLKKKEFVSIKTVTYYRRGPGV